MGSPVALTQGATGLDFTETETSSSPIMETVRCMKFWRLLVTLR